MDVKTQIQVDDEQLSESDKKELKQLFELWVGRADTTPC